MESSLPPRLSAAEGRRFGLTVGGAFLALAALLLWRNRTAAAVVAGGLGSCLLLAGLAIPRRLGPIYRAWMGLAHLISMVTTPIFMGLIYFGVFTPVGICRRLLGQNSLVRRPVGETYWVTRQADSRRGDLRRQF